MKKPAGVTKEQWAKYKRNLDLALGVMNKSLDLVADINFEAGQIVERDRIVKLLKPFAKHFESCYYNKELACTFEDCHAYDYEHAIKLIKGEQE
jgi:hypothetical protein